MEDTFYSIFFSYSSPASALRWFKRGVEELVRGPSVVPCLTIIC